MPNTVRTFIAVELSDELRRRAADLIEKLQAAQADVKWVAVHNLHITLNFLGDVPESEIVPICQAVAAVSAETAPFELEVVGAGAFPNLHRPRTIWLGAGAGQESLCRLQERIEKALRPLGFKPESRSFSPHLTVGRVRAPSPALARLTDLLNQYADRRVGQSRIHDVVVFSSQLERGGPIYEALGRCELGG